MTERGNVNHGESSFLPSDRRPHTIPCSHVSPSSASAIARNPSLTPHPVTPRRTRARRERDMASISFPTFAATPFFYDRAADRGTYSGQASDHLEGESWRGAGKGSGSSGVGVSSVHRALLLSSHAHHLGAGVHTGARASAHADKGRTVSVWSRASAQA